MVIVQHCFSRVVYAVMACSLLAFGVQAMAQAPNTTTLLARLSGASVVPPNNSEASGNLQATLDKQTRVLTWTLSINGLSGPPVGASFNGPAMPGDNAAVTWRWKCAEMLVLPRTNSSRVASSVPTHTTTKAPT